MTKIKEKILPFVLGGVLIAGSVGVCLSVGAAGESEIGSPADLWTLPAGVTAQSDVSVPDYMLYGKEFDQAYNYTEYTQDSEDLGLEEWQKNGVKFSPSAANRWVEYKNVVDISDYSSNDILLAFTPLTSTRGNAEIYEFDVKITDAENENNYILIKIKPSQWYPATFTAETAETGPYGYMYGDYQPAYSEGTSSFSDKYLVGFDGTTDETAFAAQEYKVDKTEVRHRSIILHYDYEDKAVWVTGQQGIKFCIMDLDYSESVGYGNEWEGFSDGRVKLSFCSKQHRAGEPSYMVLNAFNTPMNGSAVTDTQAPVLSFGKEVQGDQAPAAIVGREYNLPAYYCLDTVSGELSCEITLTDPDGETVATDGKTFTPQKEGYYTLSYTGEDASGNRVSKSLRFTAQKAAPAVTVLAEAENTQVSVGQQVVLPSAEFVAGEGAYIVDTDVRVVRSATSEIAEIDQGVFIPLFAGEYRAEYTATDWLGIVHTHTVVYDVSEAEATVTHGSLQHLRRLFDGVSVLLPTLNAYDYASIPGSGIAQDVQVKLSGNGAEVTQAAGSVFVPDIEKFGTELTVTYLVNGYTAETYTVEIREKPDEYAEDYVDDGSYQLDDYFLFGEGVDVEYNEGGAEIEYYRIRTGEGVTGDRTFGFVNPLRADGFNISFFIPADMKNFSAIRLSLRDSSDASVGFDLLLEDILTSRDPSLKDTYTFLTTNGGQKYTLRGTYNYYKDGSEVVSTLTVTYRDGCIYDINGQEVCRISENFDGKTWEGFSSGMVYFDVTFEGVGSLSAEENGNCAAMAISSLCGQAFYVTYNETENEQTGETEYSLANFIDISSPQIVMNGSFPSDIALGMRIELPSVSAFDALSPYVEITVTVQTPGGSTVYSNEPLKEGMSFVVDSYGMYYIRYTATDASYNTYTSTYSVSAADTQAPTIALSSSAELSGKAGKKVTLPSAVVQDNRDTAPRLFVFVVQPDLSMLKLGEYTSENKITSFTPETAGRYTVIYYAIDVDYNAAISRVIVVVE